MPEDQPTGDPGPGSTVDISALVSTYHGDLYGYAYRLCGSAFDAEDLVQQAFLIAHQKCHQIRNHAAARGWLYTVLRNCYLKDRRRRRPDVLPDVDLPAAQLDSEHFDDQWIDHEELQSALDELPDRFKVVLVMFYYEECSYRDIASRLGIAPGTVMSRLSRAKSYLRKKLSGGEQRKAQPVRTAENQ
ncbi:MAG: sigma-70 family RNA polymerase sigma factor [Pirellulales bacterium]